MNGGKHISDPLDEHLSSYPSDILHYFRTREGIAFIAEENIHGRNKLKEESVA